MFSREPDNFINRVRQALVLPVRTRCAELTVLFDRGSTAELQNFFPLLINSIFGPQGGTSWNLRTGGFPEEDFRQLQHFLSPCGPVFKLIYTLLKDPSVKYEYPVTLLPKKIKQILGNAQLHPFYADLVHNSPQTNEPICLLLNPFDYYMFHFAYHLVNPWHQRTGANSTLIWNTVYYVLCCDYMLHFLSTDSVTPVQPVIYYNGKSPLQHYQQVHNLRSPVGSKLINMSVLNQTVEDYALHQNFGRHPRNEIWRSETVLTVFIDIWMNSNDIYVRFDEMNLTTTHQTSISNNTLYPPSTEPYLELPSGEYMRIVRVLVKQLHAFSASAKVDESPMCELKKIAIPMIQGKFYIMLRHLINRWPLDGSFRLVLELWLTYIQPWRYPPNHVPKEQCKLNLSAEDSCAASTHVVEREQLPFIVENLLTYIVIFQQLLPRFSRVDLMSPKMSIMFYRITKVFNQPNLPGFLKEVEHCVENNQSPSHAQYTWASNLPPLNPTGNWCTNTSFPSNIFLNRSSDYPSMNDASSFMGSSKKHVQFQSDLNNSTFINSLSEDKKWSAIVRQKIYELEGPSFCYKPLFTIPPATEVYELTSQIQKIITVSNEIIAQKKAEQQLSDNSIWGWFKSVLHKPLAYSDELTIAERERLTAYLDCGLKHLMGMFEITEVPNVEIETSAPANSMPSEFSSDVKFLTQEKVRERIKRIKYEGDPDLHPIRSTEITFLIRMFYQLSLKLNEKYKNLFCELYYNPNYLGKFSRQILAPPITIYHFDKTRPGSPRISIDLPPRVSLRQFANYTFVTYFCLGAMIAKCFGYSFIEYLLFSLFIGLMYKGIKAFWSPPVRHNYPTEGFGNISFNDSF